MTDILREADEALERERMARLFKEYGPILLLAAIALIVATGAITLYRGWDARQDQKETAKLIAASGDAAKLENAAKETRNGHETVALLNAAAIHADKKEFAKAADLYKRASADAKAPQDLRDLATILQSRAMLLTNEKSPDYQAALDTLLPVARNDKSVFILQAKLDAAALYGGSQKEYGKALELLKGFDGDSVADSLQEKARALKHVYEYEQSKISAKKG